MIQEGKNKIMTLKQLGNIRPQVMDKLHEIVKPIDERREFKKYWNEKVKQDQKEADWKDSMDPKLVQERREHNRKLKREYLLEQMRKPDRDILQMSLTNNDYDIKVNDQVTELKSLLA